MLFRNNDIRPRIVRRDNGKKIIIAVNVRGVQNASAGILHQCAKPFGSGAGVGEERLTHGEVEARRRFFVAPGKIIAMPTRRFEFCPFLKG